MPPGSRGIAWLTKSGPTRNSGFASFARKTCADASFPRPIEIAVASARTTRTTPAELMCGHSSVRVRFEQGGYRMRARIGVSVMPLENRRGVMIGLATEADRLGYDGFFMPETWAFDMTVLLAEAAVRTRRIAVGTGIPRIWNRSAAAHAVAARTLHAVSGGR